MSKEFTQAISKELDALYPTYSIYVDNVEQGFTEPCFYIKIVDSGMDKKLDRRREKEVLYDIMVFKDIHSEQINFDFEDIADNLYENLELITVGTSEYRTLEKKHRVVDEVLHFQFKIVNMLFKTASTEDLIEEIEINTSLEE